MSLRLVAIRSIMDRFILNYVERSGTPPDFILNYFFTNIVNAKCRSAPLLLNSKKHTMSKEFYRRRLPHWQPENGVFDINFRLEGSLPKTKWLALKETRELKIKELKEALPDESTIKLALENQHNLFYGKFDELLDKGDFGPTWLKEPDITKIIAEAFHYRHSKGIFKLVCFSIMPNHVHAIIYKLKNPLDSTIQSLKSRTARKANILLDRTGQSFWQQEGYDHNIRNRQSLQKRIHYNLSNPVVAGLCSHWADWHGNFLNPEFKDWMDF